MPARVAAVRPMWAIEGGRIIIEGAQFPINDTQIPKVHIGGALARVVYASTTKIAALGPSGLEGGRMPIRIDGVPGEVPLVDVAPPLATGLHQVDNPVFDRGGNLYVTFSGTRGQQAPVSI